MCMQACQRHWTDGGTLRKVETGAGKRNSRRARGSGSISTSEAGAPVHSKYARVSREMPHQHWAHENFMHHRAQLMPMVPGAAPSYFDTTMQDHNSSDANISFQEGSSFNPDKVRCQSLRKRFCAGHAQQDSIARGSYRLHALTLAVP